MSQNQLLFDLDEQKRNLRSALEALEAAKADVYAINGVIQYLEYKLNSSRDGAVAESTIQKGE